MQCIPQMKINSKIPSKKGHRIKKLSKATLTLHYFMFFAMKCCI